MVEKRQEHSLCVGSVVVKGVVDDITSILSQFPVLQHEFMYTWYDVLVTII